MRVTLTFDDFGAVRPADICARVTYTSLPRECGLRFALPFFCFPDFASRPGSGESALLGLGADAVEQSERAVAGPRRASDLLAAPRADLPGQLGMRGLELPRPGGGVLELGILAEAEAAAGRGEGNGDESGDS